jgi:mono/diheme cytochrome c family protein
VKYAALLLLALGVGALTVRAEPPAAVVPSYGAVIPYALGQAEAKRDADRWDRLMAELAAQRKDLADIKAALGVKAAKRREDQVAEVLAARCASCHTAPKGKGGVSLFTAEGTLIPYDQRRWREIAQSVLDGTMPKGSVLPAPEKELFDK